MYQRGDMWYDFRTCDENNQAQALDRIEFYLVEINGEFLCAFPTEDDMNEWKESCCDKSANDCFLKGSEFCIKVYFHYCSMGINYLRNFKKTDLYLQVRDERFLIQATTLYWWVDWQTCLQFNDKLTFDDYLKARNIDLFKFCLINQD